MCLSTYWSQVSSELSYLKLIIEWIEDLHAVEHLVSSFFLWFFRNFWLGIFFLFITAVFLLVFDWRGIYLDIFTEPSIYKHFILPSAQGVINPVNLWQNCSLLTTTLAIRCAAAIVVQVVHLVHFLLFEIHYSDWVLQRLSWHTRILSA